MFRKPKSLSKQLVLATALALGASSVALADDSSMNPSIRDFNNGQNRENLNAVAQSPCPQSTETASTQQKKVEREIKSKTPPANGRAPLNSFNDYYQHPGQ